MFLLEDPRGQRRHGVAIEHGYRSLQDDRTRVELLRDQVNGDAGYLHAVLERLALRVDAGKRRQQRWMDVEDSIREGVNHRRAKQSHESCETDEVDASRLEFGGKCSVIGIA